MGADRDRVVGDTRSGAGLVDGRATVAVVDDEPELADLFTVWLEPSYEVRTVYGGEAALGAIDAGVDVVLVDRLMPSVSGDEVVASLTERGWTGGIAMVTAVEPDFDIVELGLDDYLLKPVRGDVLEATVERLLERSAYEGRLRELFALATKRATLETRKSEVELAGSREYGRLVRAIAELRERIDETAAGFDARAVESALRTTE